MQYTCTFSVHRKSAQCAILTGCIQCSTFAQHGGSQHGGGHGQHGGRYFRQISDPRQIVYDEFDVCFLCVLGSF